MFAQGQKIHSLKRTKTNSPNRTNIGSDIGTGSCELFVVILTFHTQLYYLPFLYFKERHDLTYV